MDGDIRSGCDGDGGSQRCIVDHLRSCTDDSWFTSIPSSDIGRDSGVVLLVEVNDPGRLRFIVSHVLLFKHLGGFFGHPVLEPYHDVLILGPRKILRDLDQLSQSVHLDTDGSVSLVLISNEGIDIKIDETVLGG